MLPARWLVTIVQLSWLTRWAWSETSRLKLQRSSMGDQSLMARRLPCSRLHLYLWPPRDLEADIEGTRVGALYGVHYRNQAVCTLVNSEHRRAARELQKQALQQAAFVRSRDHSFRSPWKEDAGSWQKGTEPVSPEIRHSKKAWCLKACGLQSDELGSQTGLLRHTGKLHLV